MLISKYSNTHFQCHMIIQESFQYADLVFKKHVNVENSHAA